MDNIRVMQIVDSFTDLIENVSSMFFLENIALTNQSMKIDIHVLENQIDIDVIICFHDSF